MMSDLPVPEQTDRDRRAESSMDAGGLLTLISRTVDVKQCSYDKPDLGNMRESWVVSRHRSR